MIDAADSRPNNDPSANQAITVFRLYIADETFVSVQAVNNFKAICLQHVPEPYRLELVDILQQPLRALSEGILVTPTLVRLSPLPIRTIVGDLNDRAAVLNSLGLKDMVFHGKS